MVLIGVAIKVAKNKKVRRLVKGAAKRAAKQVKVTRNNGDLELAVGNLYKVSAREIKDTIKSRSSQATPALTSTAWDDADWMN